MPDSADAKMNVTQLQTSKMRFYSYGIVAANKELGSKIIEVTPLEEATMLDGEITTRSTDYAAKGIDELGKSYQTSVEAQASIKAQWLRFGDSNRISPPDVRRGESVMIFQFGDADKYWWMSMKADANLRKLETVIYAFSATTDEGAETDAEHSYYLEVSTHRGLTAFHTSTANGEACGYDIQINGKEGSFLVRDTLGNYFEINSVNGSIKGSNFAGTYFEIDKGIARVKAPELIELESPNLSFKGNITHAGNQTTSGSMDIKKGLAFGEGGVGKGGLSMTGGISATLDITTSGEVHGSNI